MGSGINLTNLKITKILLNIIKNKKIKIGKKVKIKFVKDRPGHDLRYALNSNKIRKFLKWRSKKTILSGLSETFDWYYSNKKFYDNFSKKLFFKRLGLKV